MHLKTGGEHHKRDLSELKREAEARLIMKIAVTHTGINTALSREADSCNPGSTGLIYMNVSVNTCRALAMRRAWYEALYIHYVLYMGDVEGPRESKHQVIWLFILV